MENTDGYGLENLLKEESDKATGFKEDENYDLDKLFGDSEYKE